LKILWEPGRGVRLAEFFVQIWRVAMAISVSRGKWRSLYYIVMRSGGVSKGGCAPEHSLKEKGEVFLDPIINGIAVVKAIVDIVHPHALRHIYNSQI
jgi:hypothetical protein